MKAQIKLGRIFGIPIGLHYSWLIIAFLITMSLSANFQSTNPGWSNAVVWFAATLTAFLFFASIVIHELSHSMVARAHGLAVRSITLFALGGVSETEKDSPDPRTEFWMAIAGPIASAIIGLVCLGIARLMGWELSAEPMDPLPAVLVWLGYINLMLAAFNMVPGFPLDGGRVLRGIVWWITSDRNKATHIAAHVGQVVAYMFIVGGVFRFFNGAGLGGLWISFIGWFVLEAARSSEAQIGMADMLREVSVGDVMSRDYVTVDGRSNIRTFADVHLLKSGQRCFVVTENGKVAGLITSNEVRQIPPARWPYTTVDEVMRPLDQLQTVATDTPVMTALEIMGREDVNQLPVLLHGNLEGIISRGHVVQVLQNRTALHR